MPIRQVQNARNRRIKRHRYRASDGDTEYNNRELRLPDPLLANDAPQGERCRNPANRCRPAREQPYYHLFAENDKTHYVAYVSEQNLIADYSGQPVDHPDIPDLFGPFEDGLYPLHFQLN